MRSPGPCLVVWSSPPCSARHSRRFGRSSTAPQMHPRSGVLRFCWWLLHRKGRISDWVKTWKLAEHHTGLAPNICNAASMFIGVWVPSASRRHLVCKASQPNIGHGLIWDTARRVSNQTHLQGVSVSYTLKQKEGSNICKIFMYTIGIFPYA